MTAAPGDRALRVWDNEGGHVAGPTPRWHRTIDDGVLGDDSAVRVDVGGRLICLARSGGALHAVADACTHGQVPLSEGEVENGFVECCMHGSRFSLSTGVPTGPPATTPVAVYPVRVVDGAIEVAVP